MYAPIAHGIARDYFIAGADRDDVLQEALIGLLLGLRAHRPELGPLRPFLTLVVRRRVQTALRLANAQKHVPLTTAMREGQGEDGEANPIVDLLPGGLDPYTVLAERETLAALVDASRSLSALERRAVMGLACGLTYAEIEGKPSGSFPKWVDNAAQRARAKLRRAA